MADWPVGGRDCVERVQLRRRSRGEGGHSAVALRLRVDRWLSAVALRPPELPGGAVLIVRRLRGLPAVPEAALLPGRVWEGALRDRLADLYQRAARPGQGPLPPDAESILFDDPAHMVAALTRDVLAGTAGGRWYWQRWLSEVPAADPGAVLAHVWSAQAPFLPAALALLEKDEVEHAVRRFAPREVSQVVRALHSSFELPAAVLRVTAPEAAAPRTGPSLPAESAPPWRPFWPGRPLDLSLPPQAHYLIGLGLSLRHAPAYARSAAFAARAARWLQQALAAQVSGSATAWPEASHPATPSRGGGSASWPERAPAASPGLRSEQPASQVEDSADGDSRTWQPAAPREPGAEPLSPPIAEAARLLPAQEQAVQEGLAALPNWEGIQTAWGGVLYLVNLLTWLGLPDEWAEHLSGWAMIEALARGLLAEAGLDCADDPLWAILAALDGRSADAPAGPADLPFQAFRLPSTWLARDSQGARRWLAAPSADRLRLFDEAAHYLVADVPLAGRSVEEAAQAEVEGYRAGGIEAEWQVALLGQRTGIEDRIGESVAPGLRQWLIWTLGFIRHLLARALGDPRMDATALVETLLLVPGRVLISRTHVDLVAPLEAVRIAVRRAGLDRDPGWVPDLGYVVYFHFGEL